VKRSNIVIFLILGVLIAASPALTRTNAESRSLSALKSTQDNERIRTENIIKLAYSARKQAHLTLSLASNYNVSEGLVDEAESNYTAGEELLMRANATLYGEAPAVEETWANLTLARSLALEAMHQFKAAMSTIMGYWGETDHPAGWRGLSEAIQRAEDFIKKITALVETTREEYPEYNYSVIDWRLNEANKHLAWAKANMTALKINMTVREMELARNSLIQINAEVKKISNSTSVQAVRISNYVDTSLKNLIQDVQTSAKLMGKNVSLQVSAVQLKINDAETFVTSGDMKGALSAIYEAHRMIVDVSKNLTQANTEKTAPQS